MNLQLSNMRFSLNCFRTSSYFNFSSDRRTHIAQGSKYELIRLAAPHNFLICLQLLLLYIYSHNYLGFFDQNRKISDDLLQKIAIYNSETQN